MPPPRLCFRVHCIGGPACIFTRCPANDFEMSNPVASIGGQCVTSKVCDFVVTVLDVMVSALSSTNVTLPEALSTSTRSSVYGLSLRRHRRVRCGAVASEQ